MSRSDRLGERMRGVSGKYIGRPSLCEKEPGKKQCFKKLRGHNPGICRNCYAPEVQAIRLKVFGG
ncbi:MAG: hypothetical protein WCL13_03695 [bacterium]